MPTYNYICRNGHKQVVNRPAHSRNAELHCIECDELMQKVPSTRMIINTGGTPRSEWSPAVREHIDNADLRREQYQEKYANRKQSETH